MITVFKTDVMVSLKGANMAGARLANDYRFECHDLEGKTVESCIGYSESEIENEVDIVILKVKELALCQRYFLDAGIGFWEELDYASAIEDFEGLKKIDIGKQYSLVGERISSITCHGAVDTVSSIIFDIQGIKLVYRLADENNVDSGAVLEKLNSQHAGRHRRGMLAHALDKLPDSEL